jgi:hypothetical protein
MQFNTTQRHSLVGNPAAPSGSSPNLPDNDNSAGPSCLGAREWWPGGLSILTPFSQGKLIRRVQGVLSCEYQTLDGTLCIDIRTVGQNGLRKPLLAHGCNGVFNESSVAEWPASSISRKTYVDARTREYRARREANEKWDSHLLPRRSRFKATSTLDTANTG